MPYTQQKQDVFRPVHAAHAIEQASLTVNFDRPLGDTKMSEVHKIASQFKAELPGIHSIQSGFPFMIGDPAIMKLPPFPQHNPSAMGVLMNRTAPDGSIESELRLEQTSISFRTSVYTRWPSFFGEASNYFSSVIRAYMSAGTGVANINITFVDKFIWNGDSNKCDPSLLIKKDSKYIANHVFSVNDLWHTHTGSFSSPDKKTKRLINVNIDCLDDVMEVTPRRSTRRPESHTNIF